MKKMITVMLTLALASIGYAETIEKEFDIAGGNELTLDLETGGSVYISGWEKNKVGVKVHVSGIDSDAYYIDFDSGSSRITINSDYKGGWFRKNKNSGYFEFDIKVPSEFDLQIETLGGDVRVADVKGKIKGETMGGDLEFLNIEGDIEFETMGGGITAHKINGILDLETMGGNITVTDSKADGRVSTMGGWITIENVDGGLEGSTMGGEVSYYNVTGISGSGRAGDEVNINSMGGAISIDSAPMGATLETKGGEITVRSAGKFVDAETLGGDIRIYEIDGWVRAKTLGGNVTVNMVGDPNQGQRDVTISSLGGDIELTIPDGLSMDFDIEIAYTKDARRDYEIISDFEIKQKRSDRWENSRGSKRKFIYGTGQVGDGSNKIEISTINGDVLIKRGR